MSRTGSELASRIARWRTGDPSVGDDGDAFERSVGPSKFWWHDTKAAEPSSSKPQNTAHARVNAVVEARTRRLARNGGTTAKARVAVRVAEGIGSSSQSAEIAERELTQLSRNNPDLREALSLIRRGPDGKVTVGSLRRAEATMRENYARSARASAELGYDNSMNQFETQNRQSVPSSARSSMDYSGSAYRKVDDLLASPWKAVLQSPGKPVPLEDRPPWDNFYNSPAKATRQQSAKSLSESTESLAVVGEHLDVSVSETAQHTVSDVNYQTVQVTFGVVNPEMEPEQEEAIEEEETQPVDEPETLEVPAVTKSPVTSVPSTPTKDVHAVSPKLVPAVSPKISRSPEPSSPPPRSSPPMSPVADIPEALMSPEPAIIIPKELLKMDSTPTPELPPFARSPPEKTAALAAKEQAHLSGRDVDTDGLVAAGGQYKASSTKAVVRAAARDIDLLSEIARKAAADTIALEYERAVEEDRSERSNAAKASGSRRLDEWSAKVTQHSRDAEKASVVIEAQTAAKSALHDEWSQFQLNGTLPTDPLLLDLAKHKLNTDKEQELLKKAIMLTNEKLRAAQRKENEKKQILIELHEKAQALERKVLETKAEEAKAEEIAANLPPIAHVVPEEDIAPTLSDLRSKIALDLDESVGRVTRAVRGQPVDLPTGLRNWSADSAQPVLPSHAYPLTANPVAPVVPQLEPVMTKQQVEQYEERLRATRRLKERVDMATLRQHEMAHFHKSRQEPPAYAFTKYEEQGDDEHEEGSVFGDAPTPQRQTPPGAENNYAAVPSHWQSPPKPSGAQSVPPPSRAVPQPVMQPVPPVVAESSRDVQLLVTHHQEPVHHAQRMSPPPYFPPPEMPAPSFSFERPPLRNRVTLTGRTPREFISDDVERAYAESLAQQKAVFGDL